MTDQTPPPPDDQSSDEPGATTTAPPPTPTPSQPRPLFRRSSTDKVLGGVAGGLARTFAVDTVIVRIVTVVLALTFPPAFIAYLAAWLLVARDGEPSRPPTAGIAFRQTGGLGFWIGVVILAGALLAAFDDPFNNDFSLVPLVLVGIGIALWTRDGGSARATAGTDGTSTWPATTQGAAMSATSAPPAPADGGAPPAQPPTDQWAVAQQPPPGPPPPPRPRSPLGAITIGVALIVTGIVAALDQVEGIPMDADPSHLAAVALLVLGLGQLVGTRFGRARWLSLVAIFLIPPVIAGAAYREIDAAWDLDLDELGISDGAGERTIRPVGATDLPDDVRLMAGSVRIDLADWKPEEADVLDGDEDLVIDLGAGEVILTTPTDVPWRLLGEVRIGEILVDEAGPDGTSERISTEDVGESLTVLRTGGPQDGEVLDIVVDLRLGQLTVLVPEFDTQELS